MTYAVPVVLRASSDLKRCHHIIERARDRGAPAVVDAVLEVVLTACPRCHGEQADPQRIYLPLWVIPRGNQTIFRCDSCGLERVR